MTGGDANVDGLSPRTRALGAAFRVLLSGAVLAMLLLLVHGAMRAEQQRADLKRVLGVLVECTTDPAERKDAKVRPGEDDCYIRQQNRTAAAVGQIGDLSVIAAACGAANPGDIPATRACVEKALRDR